MNRKNFGGSETIKGADVTATLYTVIESAKKLGLQPKEYLKYVITKCWHNQDPKSAVEVSLETIGPNTKVVFPNKDLWKIIQ